MNSDLLKAIKEYKKNHPEIDEIMRKFQMSKEAYDRALTSIGIRIQRTGPTYTLTTGGKYNANISKST